MPLTRGHAPLRWAAGLFALGLGVAVLAGLGRQAANAELQRTRLQALAQAEATRLAERLRLYEYGLRGARGAVIAAGGEAVTRERFNQYSASRDLVHEFPGARGIGFIRRVLPAQEAAFLERARSEGPATFALRQLEPHPGERFVIQYIEPMQGNAAAVGLDIASEPQRRAAALAAQHSGQARLTAPITIVQAAAQGPRSFLLLLPVYRSSATPAVEQRDAQTFGWVYAPLVMDEVLRDFNNGGTHALALMDATPPGAPQRFFASPAWHEPTAADLVQEMPLQVFGRQWRLQVLASPVFTARLNLQDPVGLAAVLVAGTGLLSLLLHGALQAAQRERVIRLERSQSAAVVDSAHDAIVRHTLDDAVVAWNLAAQRLLGWSGEEVRGRSLMALIVPPERLDEACRVNERVRRGEDVPPFDTVRLDREGC